MGTKQCKCHSCGKTIVRKVAPSIKSKLHFCNVDCKAAYQKTKKPVTREWLIEHYIDKQLDCTQIAHMVGRDPKSVWNWLKDFEIPTRKRGTDKRQHFKKGCVSAFKGRKHTDELKQLFRRLAKEQGRVPWKKENGPPQKGKFGDKSTNWKGGVTPERQKVYGSREWKLVARAVWARDKSTCQRCGCERKKGLSFDIHHRISFANKKTRMDLSNLVLLCKPCHYWVHSKENVNKEFIDDECYPASRKR